MDSTADQSVPEPVNPRIFGGEKTAMTAPSLPQRPRYQDLTFDPNNNHVLLQNTLTHQSILPAPISESPHMPSGIVCPVLEGTAVSYKIDFREITTEYAKEQGMPRKEFDLLKAKFSHYRRISSDASCGWRAVGFAYMESLTLLGKERLEEEIARIKSLNNLLKRSGGFQESTFEDTVAETINLLTDLATSVGVSAKNTEETLVARFRNPAVSNAIVCHFRWLTSSWLQRHSSAYKYQLGKDWEIQTYAKNWLEAPSNDIDEFAMTLFVEVLLQPLGVFLNISHLGPAGQTLTNWHTIPATDHFENRQVASSASPIYLICQAHHYDILYEGSFSTSLVETSSNLPDQGSTEHSLSRSDVITKRKSQPSLYERMVSTNEKKPTACQMITFKHSHYYDLNRRTQILELNGSHSPNVINCSRGEDAENKTDQTISKSPTHTIGRGKYHTHSQAFEPPRFYNKKLHLQSPVISTQTNKYILGSGDYPSRDGQTSLERCLVFSQSSSNSSGGAGDDLEVDDTNTIGLSGVDKIPRDVEIIKDSLELGEPRVWLLAMPTTEFAELGNPKDQTANAKEFLRKDKATHLISPPAFTGHNGLENPKDQRATAKEFVGEKKAIHLITEDLSDSSSGHTAQLRSLSRKYTHYRVMLGDGNAGLRAVVFSYFEVLIRPQNKETVQQAITRLDSQNRLLLSINQVGNELLSCYVSATMKLLKEVENHLKEPTVAMDLLVQRFNDPEISTYILGHFRMLCSSWLKQHADSRGYRSFISSSMGIDAYCTYFLEAPNQELDSLAMTLLVDILLKPAMFTIHIQNPDREENEELNCKGVESTGEFADSFGAATIHLLHYRSYYAVLYRSKVDLENLLLLIPGFYPTLPSYHALPWKNQASVDTNPARSTSLIAPFLEATPLLQLSSKQRPLAVFASTKHTSPVSNSADSAASVVCGSTQIDVPSSPPDIDHAPKRGKEAAWGHQDAPGINGSEAIAVFGEDHSGYMTDFDSVTSGDESSLSDIGIASQVCSPHGHPKDHDDLIRPILDPIKAELVERIMSEFWKVFQLHWANNIRRCTPSPTHSDSSRGATSQGGATSQHTPNAEHHKRKEYNKEDNEDISDGDDRKNPKRPRKAISMLATMLDDKRFACPYRKHDPKHYSVQHWRSCALTSLENISRVKNHLYRHHRVYQCQRCKVIAESQDALNEHFMQVEGCKLVSGEQVEGVTCEIEKRLRSRKKSFPGQTEVQRWKEIYNILFPNEDVPCPYFEPILEDNTTGTQTAEFERLANYEEYARRELPRFFRSTLETIVHNETQPIEERLKSQLTSIIQDCQDRVFSNYRASLSFHEPIISDALGAQKLPDDNDKASTDLRINQVPEILGKPRSNQSSAYEYSGTLFMQSSPEFIGPDVTDELAPGLPMFHDLLKSDSSTATTVISNSMIQRTSGAYSNDFDEQQLISGRSNIHSRDFSASCGEDLVAAPGPTVEWLTTPFGTNLEHLGWDTEWIEEPQAGVAYLPEHAAS